MGSVAGFHRPQRPRRGALGRRVPGRLRAALGRNDHRVALDPADRAPFDPATPRLSGPALDEAAWAAHQSDDLAAVAMHFVHSPEALAFERLHLLVAKLGQP